MTLVATRATKEGGSVKVLWEAIAPQPEDTTPRTLAV